MDCETRHEQADRFEEGIKDRASSLPSLTDIRTVDEGLCLVEKNFVMSDVSISDIELSSSCLDKHDSVASVKDSLSANGDSEGYSSFHSNSSFQSSPCTSSQASPISDELISPAYCSCQVIDDNACTHKATHLSKSDVTQQFRFLGSEEQDGKDAVDSDNFSGNMDAPCCSSGIHDRLVFDLSRVNSDGKTCESNAITQPPAEHISTELKQDDTLDGPQKMNILFGRKMSTIEEGTEDTPSPRSHLNIDAEFKYAARGFGKNRGLTNLCEESSETKSEISEKKNNKQDFGGFVEHDDSSENDCFDSISSEKAFTDHQLPARPLIDEPAGICHHNTSTANDEDHHEFLMNEKMFDIDLDAYDIPYERRQSLELRLDELRDFINRILKERKSLEEDRVLLNETLDFVNRQRNVVHTLKEEKKDLEMPSVGSEEVQSDNTDKVSLADNVVQETVEFDGLVHYKEGIDAASEQDTSSKCCTIAERSTDKQINTFKNQGAASIYAEFPATQEDFEDSYKIGNNIMENSSVSCTAFEYEELLANLEEALLENVDLKNENMKLSAMNEELQQRIEELLTDEEEMQYRMNEATLKLMEESQRQRDENGVLKSNFNRVLKDYNALENEFKEFEMKYEDLLSERESLLTRLSVKNESFYACKEQCDKLSKELEEVKEKIDSCSSKQDKIWSRSDWEDWTVLQTRLSATEKALFDSRKQKSQLVCDMKAMKASLEASKDKILDAENAMHGLEWTLERAQENNQLLHSENQELRLSLLKYEMNLLEMNRLMHENAERSKALEVKESVADKPCEQKIEGISPQACADTAEGKSEQASKEETEEVVLRQVSKRPNVRRVMTFPSTDTELPRDCPRDVHGHADVFADCQYQNAFQEVGVSKANSEALKLVTETQCLGTMNINSKNEPMEIATEERPKLLKKSKHSEKGNMKKCLPLKMLLPSVMQSILHSRSKKSKAAISTLTAPLDDTANAKTDKTPADPTPDQGESSFAQKKTEIQSEADEEWVM